MAGASSKQIDTYELRDVPAESLAQLVADFNGEGAKVDARIQKDGMFTVRAVFVREASPEAVREGLALPQ